MKIIKSILFVLVFITFISFSYSNYEYSGYGWLSYSINLNHDQNTNIQYQISNKNIMCQIHCQARVTSSVYNSNYETFSINAGRSKILNFGIRSPTKQESNYNPSGSIDYNLDIVCYDDNSLFCGGEVSNGKQIGETTFRVIYDLNLNDRRNKEYLENEIVKFQNNLNKISYLYQTNDNSIRNLKNQILLSDIEREISQINNILISFERDINQVKNNFDMLDFSTARRLFDSIGFSSKKILENQLEEIKNEIEFRKNKQKEINNYLEVINFNLNGLNDRAFIFNHEEEYLNLVLRYNSKLNKVENLQFNNYNDLEIEVLRIVSDIDELSESISNSEKIILENIENKYSLEYSKIDEIIPSFSTNSVQIVNTFCQDFRNTLPIKFNNFNEFERNRIFNENEEIKTYNSKIESYNEQWSKLENIIFEIEDKSKNNFHSEIENTCNNSINELNSNSFSVENLNSTIKVCTEMKNSLFSSIETNQQFPRIILNYITSIFKRNNNIELPNLNNLDSYKKEIILEPSLISLSEESEQLIQNICDNSIIEQELKRVSELNLEYETIEQTNMITFEFNSEDCNNNVCYNNRDYFPVLFVHGHLFNSRDDVWQTSLNTFSDMIRFISNNEDNFYNNGIIVSAGSENLGSDSQRIPKSALYRTTYYGGVINNQGNFEWRDSKFDSISDYADKLKETIDSTLALTNRKQIKIVSHSMGGLVTREYIRKYGADKIDTFIMIGTPNQGIEGNIASSCVRLFLGILYEGAEIECQEMTKNSHFLRQLNSMDSSELPQRTFIINAVYSDSQSDGIVLFENSKIDDVTEFTLQSEELTPLTPFDPLHNRILRPSLYPEVSEKVIEILLE